MMGNFRRNISDPNTLGGLSYGLLAGSTPQEQLAMGFGGMVQGAGVGRQDRLEQQRLNKTIEFLRTAGADPALVQMAEAGDVTGAFKEHLARTRPQQVKKPTSIQEYEFARQQGYDGSFVDFQTDQRKAGATNVTVGGGRYGTIPQGYQLVETDGGARMVPIPGGPADTSQNVAKQQSQAGQKATVARQAIADIRGVLDDKSSLTDWNLPEAGIVGSKLADWGVNQQAVDVRRKLETLQSVVAFDRLQQMREASPTGGALGAVSERELALLQSSMGALSQDMSPEELSQTLEFIDSVMKKFEAYPGYQEPLQQPAQPNQMNRTSSGIQWSIE